MKHKELLLAARDQSPVKGMTHGFYRYPARFSPVFARAAIEAFSNPGDMVLDPFMGGGTTVIEAMTAGRCVVGCDLNSLSVFLTRVKTTPLGVRQIKMIERWSSETIDRISYRHPRQQLLSLIDDPRTHNMTSPSSRAIKKAIAVALDSIKEISSASVCDFVRCVILRTSQWALDGRRYGVSLKQFRIALEKNLSEMLYSIKVFGETVPNKGRIEAIRTLVEGSATEIHKAPVFVESCRKADLVVTSPPYPGVHVLYHRWQINGRRETPAPYWIADCLDGEGSSFYTFGSRRAQNHDSYFEKSLLTLRSIRAAMGRGGYIVQMLAFSDPANHLPRYLRNMDEAGFTEVGDDDYPDGRIWRDVPNRRWHATYHGRTSSSREVVLVHRAT